MQRMQMALQWLRQSSQVPRLLQLNIVNRIGIAVLVIFLHFGAADFLIILFIY